MTARETIFVGLVLDGMQRAYRAASFVGNKWQKHVEVMLDDKGDQLERADPDDLPNVRFVHQWHDADDEYEISDEVVTIQATEALMVEAIEGIIANDCEADKIRADRRREAMNTIEQAIPPPAPWD
jgi:hypothetical protein